jgi:hypothetical protein
VRRRSGRSLLADSAVNELPAPPANSAYTPDNGCNVVGGSVPAQVACVAGCLPGFIKGGVPFPSYAVGCSANTNWVSVMSGLTCTGKAWNSSWLISVSAHTAYHHAKQHAVVLRLEVQSLPKDQQEQRSKPGCQRVTAHITATHIYSIVTLVADGVL